jgi:hypothetical protein
MSHLEKLIYQYYEWKDYIVRKNIKVGRLSHGGWECELDIVGYHHQSNHLLHIEPSIDAYSWDKREEIFKKKFRAGQKYIHSEVFPWLDKNVKIEQIAVLISPGIGRDKLAEGKIVSIDQFMKVVKDDITKRGIIAKNAIPEQYDLLRTIQMAICGYYKIV